MSHLSHLSYFPDLNAQTPLKFVYTPVHGVGQPYAERAFAAFQFHPFISVDEQKDPDPEFSTVKYPNPEEGKETLECAIRTANKHNADLILANDPDADRFALAERDSSGSSSSGWRILSGNQLGTLLGWWRWFTWRNRNPTVNVKDVYMLYSTVSSHILKSIAEVEGFNSIDTLTGFKWLGNRSNELLDQKKHVLFAFEEAMSVLFVDRDDRSQANIRVTFFSVDSCVIQRTFSIKMEYLPWPSEQKCAPICTRLDEH